jgi:hypothetical protein
MQNGETAYNYPEAWAHENQYTASTRAILDSAKEELYNKMSRLRNAASEIF